MNEMIVRSGISAGDQIKADKSNETFESREKKRININLEYWIYAVRSLGIIAYRCTSYVDRAHSGRKVQREFTALIIR